MIRRLIGALLCVLLFGAATFDVYADVAKKDVSITLQFETSYFSLDPIDDANDTPYPDGIVSWSLREKVVTKLLLSSPLRKIRLTMPALLPCERLSQSRLMHQDPFRYQEVYRI
jgi:hypothetical protein